MSYRGSFVTEYIDCQRCYEAAIRAFESEVDYQGWLLPQGPTRPIIAGFVKGQYPGEVFLQFEFVVQPLLEEAICHPLRVAMLDGDGNGYRVFTAIPAHPTTT